MIRFFPLFYFLVGWGGLTVAETPPDHKAAKPAPDQEHFDAGRGLMNKEWYEAAIGEFQAALAINPRNSRTYDNLGFCFRKLHRYGEAIDAFNTATSINPRDGYAHLELAIVYCDTGNFGHAIELLNEQISLNSKDAAAHFWLGYALYRGKKDVEALAAFEEALKLRPKDFDSNYYRGLSLFRLNRLEESAQSLAKAVEIRPDDFNANFWRGMALTRLRDFKNAASSFEKAHQIKPEDKFARLQWFFCLFASNQTEKAPNVYPHLLLVIGIILVFIYAVWFMALLPFSLPLRDKPSPGFWFSFAWLGLFIEGQAAFLILLASLPSLHWHESVLSGASLSALPIIIVAGVGFARQPWGEPFRWPPRFGSPKLIMTCVTCIFGSLLVANGFAILYNYVTHNPFPMQRTIPLIRSALLANPVAAWLSVVVIIPCVEEIIFRGLLFGAFQKVWGTTGATLASSVLFVLIHLQLIGFLVLFLLGLILAWARLRTSSLALPIALHAFNNSIALLMLTFVRLPTGS